MKEGMFAHEIHTIFCTTTLKTQNSVCYFLELFVTRHSAVERPRRRTNSNAIVVEISNCDFDLIESENTPPN